MTIEWKPEQQRTIDLAVQSGAYHNLGDVPDQVFEVLCEQLQNEDWLTDQREAIVAKTATVFAQAERGELIDDEAAMKILRQRRAERLNKQR